MIIQNEVELYTISKGGVKGVKKGDKYIPYNSKILCECDDCKTKFKMNYITAKQKELHLCIKCRFKGKRNGMYNKGYLVEGNNNPFYGKTHTEKTKEKLSELNSGKNNKFYGKKHNSETIKILKNVDRSYTQTDEYKDKMRKIVTGRKHSLETREKISDGNKKALLKRNPKNFRSKLEKNFENWLIENGYKKDIDYKIQFMLHDEITSTYKFYDFYIFNKNLIIEIDGTYWHKRNQENDKFKTNLAKKKGYKLIRISDIDIQKNLHETYYKKYIF